MLSEFSVAPTLPVENLARARRFYEDKLGLKLLDTSSSGVIYECGNNTNLLLYEAKATKSKHITAIFEVENLHPPAPATIHSRILDAASVLPIEVEEKPEATKETGGFIYPGEKIPVRFRQRRCVRKVIVQIIQLLKRCFQLLRQENPPDPGFPVPDYTFKHNYSLVEKLGFTPDKFL